MDMVPSEKGVHIGILMGKNMDEGDAVQVLGINGFFFCQGMVLRYPDHEPVLLEGSPVSLEMGWTVQEGAAKGAGSKTFQTFPVSPFLQVDADMGIPAAVEGKNGGKPPGGGTEVGSDGKVSGDEGKKAVSDIFRPVFGGCDLLNGGQESFSFLRQADAVAGPGEEGKSDFLFQTVHHAGNA